MEHRIWMITRMIRDLTETACQMVVYIAQNDNGATVKGFGVLKDVIKKWENEYKSYVPPLNDNEDAK